MASVEGLIRAYDRFVSLPWGRSVAAQQRVWFALYDPRDERRLRARIGAFEAATVRSDHAWLECDLTDEFARWMSSQDYRESYFESPEDLGEMTLDEFAEHVAGVVRRVLSTADANSVVALYGIASLFGFVRVSRLMEMVAPHAPGRLLVFFPGEHDNANYRLLDGRDGWNYLAIPITSQEGASQ